MSPLTSDGYGGFRLSWSLVALVLGVFFFTAAVVLGLAYSPGGINSNSTPIIMPILGLLGVLVTAVAALVKANAVHRDTQDLKNGVIPDKMKEAVAEIVNNNNATGGTANADSR